MKGEQHQIKKAAEKIGEDLHSENAENLRGVADKIAKQGIMPKDAVGMSDAMIEGIYGQAYRLYNSGKYKDASQLFRLLIMLNTTEPKYTMGLAACFHMMKEYKNAAGTYAICGIIDSDNPIPHYHASDCYLNLGDDASALVALEMAAKRAENKPEFTTLRDRALMTIEALKKKIAATNETQKAS